nr:magnesium transporter [Nanoarchaeum sp.]
MIEKFKVLNNKFKEVKDYAQADWINVVTPTDEEITELNNKFNLTELSIKSLNDIEEIPIVEKEDGVIFLISKIPTKQELGLEYSTVPLGIILTKQKIITVCFFKNELINSIKEQKLTFSTTRFLLNLLLKSSRLYLNYLKEINRKINKIEQELEKSQKNQELMNLLDIEKSLVYFATSLRSGHLLLVKISRMKEIVKSEDDDELIGDAIDENNQAIETTNIYSNILNNSRNAYSSVIANNLNLVMKFLAAITIIISLPLLVASIYGMNIALPFQNLPNAFWIVMIISAVLSFVGAFLFWRYKLF